MRRRGAVHVLAVTVFVVAVGALATRDDARPAATSAVGPARPDAPHARPAPQDDARHSDSPTGRPAQSAQPRPPTDIPLLPISFVRRPRPALAVALTIDDGPSPTWTPKVLDLLATYHVHATFCLIGEEVVRHPELVRRIVAEGHTLCDHTWDHDEHLPSRSAAVIQREIASTFHAIEQASGGVQPVYYRAPGGNWGDGQVATVARKLGMVSLNWSVDPVDWSRPGTKKIISVVLGKTGPGDVILMHDGGGDRQQSLDALRVILPTLLARGDVFVTP